MIVFLFRYAWRALINLPVGGGAKPWVFFGTLWLIIFLGFFLYAVVGTGGDFSVLPLWFGAIFVHAGFVGMMTNLIFAVVSSRGQEGDNIMSWAEPLSMWTINLGILIFGGLKITSDIRTGAICCRFPDTISGGLQHSRSSPSSNTLTRRNPGAEGV
jgi:hypothetical protein